MSSIYANVYYNPEKHELEPVAEIDYSSGSYEFDLRVVWRHKPTNKLYTGRDSGCSCPCPFEDVNRLEDLEEFDFLKLAGEARDQIGTGGYYAADGDHIAAFIAKIARLS